MCRAVGHEDWNWEPLPYTMLQQNQQHREGLHPSLPQSLSAPTIRKTVPEHQSPLRQTAQQLFPPGCESPELKPPRPPLKPHANPYLLKHGPPQTLPHPRKKLYGHFTLCGHIEDTLHYVHYGHFTHTAAGTQSHKRLSNICMFTCSCTSNHPALFPNQLLTQMSLFAHVQYL